MTYVDLLAELSERLGLPAPDIDADTAVHFEVDEDLAIRVSPLDDGSGAELSASVGETPDEPDADFYEALLSANSDVTRVGAAFLALDEVTGDVVVRRVLPSLKAGAEAAEAELSAFAEVARTWSERLASGRLENDDAVDGGLDDAAPRGGGFIAV